MSIQSSSIVALVSMTNNLNLSGTDNEIFVDGGAALDLSQQITAAGAQNTQGGITLAGAHTGDVAVVLQSDFADDGSVRMANFVRSSTNQAGILNQVSVGGAVYNYGGAVSISSPLNITGGEEDDNGNDWSYWQDSNFQATNTTGDFCRSTRAAT